MPVARGGTKGRRRQAAGKAAGGMSEECAFGAGGAIGLRGGDFSGVLRRFASCNDGFSLGA
jgi:hypothetical protein